MSYKIKSEVYNRIANKVEDGTFTPGENCILTRYCYEGDIRNYPLSERTHGVCSYLMSYNRCKFSDVPPSGRTREFFLDSFTNDDVYNYIKTNIADFDRQFFKDLIATNRYATHFEKNCFSVMPLEYIDEEMCSLAILCSTDWSNDAWFMSVYKRKPEALTADLWNLGARLYARMSGKENKFLSITPEEFKDEEYYKEMCSCNYNCGMELETNKGKIMDSIPQEVLTLEFLVDLLLADIKNIARFSEFALETKVPHTKDEKIVFEKIWQIVVMLNGHLISNIDLNDERIEFFLSNYDKDSSEYRWGFKDNYKRYMKEKNNSEALKRTAETTKANNMMLATVILGSAMSGNPNAVDEKLNLPMSLLLPIKYQGLVPSEFCKEYDGEEYLLKMYETLGIQIGEEYDNLFYRASLPEGWTIDNERYWNNVKDSEGNTVIEYFYDSKFYDRDAYVRTITIPIRKKKISLDLIFDKAEEVAGSHMGAIDMVKTLLETRDNETYDVIATFKDKGIIGRTAYWFWKTICNEDIPTIIKLSETLKSGIINDEELHKNIPDEDVMGVSDASEKEFFKKFITPLDDNDIDPNLGEQGQTRELKP